MNVGNEGREDLDDGPLEVRLHLGVLLRECSKQVIHCGDNAARECGATEERTADRPHTPAARKHSHARTHARTHACARAQGRRGWGGAADSRALARAGCEESLQHASLRAPHQPGTPPAQREAATRNDGICEMRSRAMSMQDSAGSIQACSMQDAANDKPQTTCNIRQSGYSWTLPLSGT